MTAKASPAPGIRILGGRSIFASGSTRSPSDNRGNSFLYTLAQMVLRGRNSHPGRRWLNLREPLRQV
jgi:hypothetical protein